MVSQIRGNHMLTKRIFFYIIGLYGILALLYLIIDLSLHFNLYIHEPILFKVLFYMCLFFLFYEWSVALPSGARWKPAMVFVLFSMLNFSLGLAILIISPGVLATSIKNKIKLWDFFTTIGHLAAGITLGGLFFHSVWSSTSLNSPFALLAIVLALAIHFVVNRLIAVLILSYRKKNSFTLNAYAVIRDLNWTYISIYSLAMVMLLVDKVYSYFGSLSAIVVIFSLYKSVSYYQKYKMIANTVFIDGLTQAENRAAWELFKGELYEGSQFGSLVMADLDYFKEVNDTYGHTEGDQVLKEFVKNINERFQRPHRLFRYGGDEFVLYLPHEEGEEQGVYDQVEKIFDLQNKEWESRGLPVSVSSGFSKLCHAADINQSLERADSFMYQEKQAKKALG